MIHFSNCWECIFYIILINFQYMNGSYKFSQHFIPSILHSVGSVEKYWVALLVCQSMSLWLCLHVNTAAWVHSFMGLSVDTSSPTHPFTSLSSCSYLCINLVLHGFVLVWTILFYSMFSWNYHVVQLLVWVFCRNSLSIKWVLSIISL